MANCRKLKQILLNLLSNAIKFTPAGGSVSLFVRYAGKGDLGVSVKDTGIGIEQEDIQRVLQKFGQVENGMQRKYNGVGLGCHWPRHWLNCMAANYGSTVFWVKARLYRLPCRDPV